MTKPPRTCTAKARGCVHRLFSINARRALLAGALVLAASAASVSAAEHSREAVTGKAAAGQIAFLRSLDDAQTASAIFVSAADGSGERQLTTPPASTQDDEPNWAPDGTRLLFTRITAAGTDHEAHQLFVVAADGTGLTALTPGTPAEGAVIPGFDGTGAFSPDGQLIALSYAHGKVGMHLGSDQIQFSDIVIMNADGSNRRQVTHSAAYAGDAGGVSWSPDGKRLVYARTDARRRALFIIDTNGKHGRRLTPWSLGANGTPDWSPLTNLIVFRAVVNDESGVGNFFTIRPDGTALKQVTHFSDTVISHKVGFSPDGHRIVFAKAAANGHNDVFTAKLNGSDMQRVTHTPQADTSPDWAPVH